VRSLATPASAATAAAAAVVCYGRVRRHSSISIAAAPSLACDIVTVTVSVITLCVASSVKTSENTSDGVGTFRNVENSGGEKKRSKTHSCGSVYISDRAHRVTAGRSRLV